MNKKISIIIPTCNIENLQHVVGTIREAVKIIVVKDPEFPEITFPERDLEYVQGVKPFIFARNMNLGIQHAFNQNPGSDVVLLNDDTSILTHDCFAQLQKVAYANPKYGVVSPMIKGICGNLRQSAPRVNRDMITIEPTSLAFICVYLKFEVIQTIGICKHAAEYLDERFTEYGCDDQDYCFRALLHKYLLVISPYSLVDHRPNRHSFESRNFAHNLRLFNEKHKDYK